MTNSFYDFFAGGGMASVGLGAGWSCLLANDIDPMKSDVYRANHPGHNFLQGDIGALSCNDLPGVADLAWASFPCQDLSLAGAGRGLSGARSGVFWSFERLMAQLVDDGRAPRLVALENVPGLMSSHGGRDLETAASAIAALGYHIAMFTLDASHFTPQSRRRLFLIGIRNDLSAPVIRATPAPRDDAEARAARRLRNRLGTDFIDIRPPEPAPREMDLVDLVDWAAPCAEGARTAALIDLMSDVHRGRVDERRHGGDRHVGAVYRRTRRNQDGVRVQRAEVRFDGLAGCLRTPAGGSSRQTLILIDGGDVRSRLLTAGEAGALMGLPDSYILPARYNDAYKLCGDGVCVPVVRYIAETIFEPILAQVSAAA